MSPAASDAEILMLANNMLKKLNIETRVKSRKDVDSELFVTLFEGICGENLRDVIHSPHTSEDHAHNIQTVIDTLSMDVLNTSLSHITGHDVVAGSTRSTHNLLEVLFGVMDFILEEISSGESSGDVSHSESELNVDRQISNGTHQVNSSRGPTDLSCDLAEISSRDIENRSPQSDVHHLSISSGSHTDRTSDLIALGDRKYLRGHINKKPSFSKQSRLMAAGSEPTSSMKSFSAVKPVSTEDKIETSSNRINQFYSSQPFIPSQRSPSPLSRVEHRARSLHASTLSNRSGSNLSAFQSKLSAYQPTGNKDIGVHSTLPLSDYQYKPYESTVSNISLGADSALPFSNYQYKPYDSAFNRITVGADIPLSQDRFLSQSDGYKHMSVLPESDFDSVGGKISAAVSQPVVSSRKLGKSSAYSGAKSSSATQYSNTDKKAMDDKVSYPTTYEDYLKKYYGSTTWSHKISADDSYLSDGCVDYEPSSARRRSGSVGSTGSFGAELAQCKRELARRAKAVRFEDYLDSAAQGRTGILRRRFRGEELKTRMRKELLSKTYEDELLDLESEQKEEIKEARKCLKEKNADYEKLLNKKGPMARLKTRKASKSVIITRSRPVRKRSVSKNKRSKSASPSLNRPRMPSTGADLLPWLLEEFPFLQISPTTLLSLERMATQQLEYLAKTESQAMRRKSKAQEQIEEAEKRQNILLEIIKKEHEHKMRLKEQKERNKGDLSVNGHLRDRRIQSARVRKYYDEYQVRQRSKMLKRRSKEELMFKQLFLDSLGIEKERILELRKYAKEQREQRAKKQKDELESIENFYKDKYDMMMEKLQKSREEIDIRDKDQAKMLDKMKRELRKKMEREIEQLQEKIWTDEDEIFFRELDADRVRQQLNLTRYQSRV